MLKSKKTHGDVLDVKKVLETWDPFTAWGTQGHRSERPQGDR